MMITSCLYGACIAPDSRAYTERLANDNDAVEMGSQSLGQVQLATVMGPRPAPPQQFMTAGPQVQQLPPGGDATQLLLELYGDLAPAGYINEAGAKALLSPLEDLGAMLDHVSLLFGEVKPAGVRTLLNAQNLDAARAKHLIDLGCGFGRLCLQAWLEFPNLNVTGVEYSSSRCDKAFVALRALYAKIKSVDPTVRLAERFDDNTQIVELAILHKGRRLTLCWGDMFETLDVSAADIVVANTKIQRGARLAALLSRCEVGTRLATFENLAYYHGDESHGLTYYTAPGKAWKPRGRLAIPESYNHSGVHLYSRIAFEKPQRRVLVCTRPLDPARSA